MVDYRKLGLRVGLEIHQQLDTDKLFCRCPSRLREDKPDTVVERRQYAVAGETGAIDIAAAYEQTRGKTFVYEGYSDSTCEVEFDSSPPRELNEDALQIALQIALLLKAKPLGITQVMRKTVIDGSDPSGFQRTLLIATSGEIETKAGKVKISSVCLEEDSARKVSETADKVTFRLDRFGIPLVEIATASEITDPEAAKEVALKIGEVLRAARVKRGIGTIRQDLNVSIARGARTEIKGVQEPGLIPEIINREIERQLSLIKKGEHVEPSVRKALPDGSTAFLRPLPGPARMYPETDLPLVRIERKLVTGLEKKLPRLRSDIEAELKAKGIHPELISLLSEKPLYESFKRLEATRARSELIARCLVLYPKEIAAHEKISFEIVKERLTESVLKAVLSACSKGTLLPDSVKPVLAAVARGATLQKALSCFKLLSKSELAKVVKETTTRMKDAPKKAIIGAIMRKVRGRASGKEVAKLVSRLKTER